MPGGLECLSRWTGVSEQVDWCVWTGGLVGTVEDGEKLGTIEPGWCPGKLPGYCLPAAKSAPGRNH